MTDILPVIKGILAGFAIAAILGLITLWMVLGFFHYIDWIKAVLG